jgi:hypothetical protein
MRPALSHTRTFCRLALVLALTVVGGSGCYAFTTGSDGTASMQLVVSNMPGPVMIDVSYMRCVKPGILFDCDHERIFASLLLSAVAVR